MGTVAERGRIFPALVFIFIWNTLVYNPCSYWSLNPSGWSYKIGMLDFGGGAPVHVPAGAAAIVYSYMLGPRDVKDRYAKPHNMINILIGTVLIWFGAIGYNAGSAFAANMVGLFSFLNTNLAGAVAGLTWSFLDYLRDGKFSGFGLCAGGVVGVIMICPASGIISPISSFPMAIVTSVLCRWANIVKTGWKYDDALDVFTIHGLAGFLGMILTGVFAQISYEGEQYAEKGGWLDAHWIQVQVQLADSVVRFVWSFLVSGIVLYTMNRIPALRLRMDEDELAMGQDESEMGLNCYAFITDIEMKQHECNSNESKDGNLIQRKHTRSVNWI